MKSIKNNGSLIAHFCDLVSASRIKDLPSILKSATEISILADALGALDMRQCALEIERSNNLSSEMAIVRASDLLFLIKDWIEKK